MSEIQSIIEDAFERRADITPKNADANVRNAVNEALAMLDNGTTRVAEKQNGDWVVNQWLKKAVLLSFRLNDNKPMAGGETQYFDQVDPKFASFSEADFNKAGVRVVPPAAARRGSYIAPGVVLMPSYVNISDLYGRLYWPEHQDL